MIKKITTFGFLCTIAISTIVAQKKETTNAILAFEKNKLIEAKEHIDQAGQLFQQQTTSQAEINQKDLAKYYYYKGKIYQALYEADLTTNPKGNIETLKIANDAYLDCIKLTEKNSYKKDAEKAIIKTNNHIINLGLEAFKTEKYTDALNYFEQSLKTTKAIGITDTAVIYNAGLAAKYGNNFPKAIEYFKTINELNYAPIGKNKTKDYPSTYQLLADSYKKNKDTISALQVLKKARILYPESQALLLEELNIYIEQGKSKQAIDNIMLAISRDPDNHLLYYNAGYLHKELGMDEEAINFYKMAIEKKSDYTDAYVNLGALYLERGKKIANAADKIKDQKLYDAEQAKANADFKNAVIYVEKAAELEPTNVQFMQVLKQLYVRLDMKEKLTEINKKINASKAK